MAIPKAKKPAAFSGAHGTNSKGVAMENREDKIKALYRLISELQSIEDCQNLFDDLCTVKEIEKMAERIYAAKLLLEGKTYNQVIAQADISSATLSRVSRCVQYGKGYSRFLKK